MLILLLHDRSSTSVSTVNNILLVESVRIFRIEAYVYIVSRRILEDQARQARLNPEFRDQETQRDIQAHREARLNPEIRRDQERQKDALTRSQQRANDVYHQAKLAGLSARRQYKRNLNYTRHYRIAILLADNVEKHVIPMTQPCRHCKAIRFSGEKLKCCKQGLIKIPEAKISDELQALFNSDTATSLNSFVHIFRKYARVTNQEFSLLAPNCQPSEVGK